MTGQVFELSSKNNFCIFKKNVSTMLLLNIKIHFKSKVALGLLDRDTKTRAKNECWDSSSVTEKEEKHSHACIIA